MGRALKNFVGTVLVLACATIYGCSPESTDIDMGTIYLDSDGDSLVIRAASFTKRLPPIESVLTSKLYYSDSGVFYLVFSVPYGERVIHQKEIRVNEKTFHTILLGENRLIVCDLVEVAASDLPHLESCEISE